MGKKSKDVSVLTTINESSYASYHKEAGTTTGEEKREIETQTLKIVRDDMEEDDEDYLEEDDP
jgi:hypothetical protein